MTKLEIKGLALAMQNVKRSVALIRSELSGLHDDAWKLQKSVVELREQITQTHDDLKFEAENLGNGPEQDVASEPLPPTASLNGPVPLSTDEKNHLYRTITTNHGASHD